MNLEMLQQENAQLKYELELARKTTLEIDSISEFGADGFHITTHPVFGLQRWADKQYMLSFFPTDIKGNRLQFQSKIDKVEVSKYYADDFKESSNPEEIWNMVRDELSFDQRVYKYGKQEI